MVFSVDQKVTVTAKILKKLRDGTATTINLKDEPGLVKKTDKDHVYVMTEHGVHYLHQDMVKIIDQPQTN